MARRRMRGFRRHPIEFEVFAVREQWAVRPVKGHRVYDLFAFFDSMEVARQFALEQLESGWTP